MGALQYMWEVLKLKTSPVGGNDLHRACLVQQSVPVLHLELPTSSQWLEITAELQATVVLEAGLRH